MKAITTIINTLNSEKTLELTLNSVKDLGPIVIVDMYSDDATLQIAKKYTDQVFMHERVGYVEPARNFAIEKAQTEWVVVLDSDEELSDECKRKINELIENDSDVTHIFLPRKNVIFAHWMQHTGWWPDEKMRVFKKGSVHWKNEIHSEPECSGKGIHMEATESNAIIHHHYSSVSEWVLRMDRYTQVQAKELIESGYQFNWKDIIKKPLSEFVTRFFVWEGWKDGVHGLALSLMQSLSWVIVYMKVQEVQKITIQENEEQFLQACAEEIDNSENEVGYYLEKLGLQSQLKRWIQKVLP